MSTKSSAGCALGEPSQPPHDAISVACLSIMISRVSRHKNLVEVLSAVPTVG